MRKTESFNLRRFAHVLRYDFTTGLRSMLWFSLGMVVLYLLLFGLFHNLQHAMGPENPPEMNEFLMKTVIHEMTVAALFVAYLFVLGASCTLFLGVQRKAPRTVLLMLPASNAEKFLSRWVFLIVFSLLGSIGAFVVADLLHAGWQVLTGGPVVMATGYFLDRLPDMGRDRTYDIVSFYGLLLTLHTFCLMCGVLFRRYHLVATFAVGLLLWTVLGHLLRAVLTPESKEPVLLALMVLLTVVFTVVAYRLFCRWQVVTRKFVNL